MAEEKRKRSFAVEQANREIEAAQDRLDRAEESNSQTAIKDAQEALDEARQELADLRKGKPSDRREARKEFVQEYYSELGPYIAELVKEDPELRDLIQKAVSEGWTEQTLDRELKLTDWWKDENKTNAWMGAFRQEFGDDPRGEWKKKLSTAGDTVRDYAARYGLDLPDDVAERIARRSIYEGWNDRALQVWMAGKVGREISGDRYEAGGTIETQARSLRDLANNFGLTYSDDWFTRQANSIMNPDARVTSEDLINDMVSQAETLFPVFKGRLSGDFTLRDAAGSYLGQMANLLELSNPNEISLNDPLLGKAFGSAMDGNEPKLMSLWDFQREVKKDERWQTTNNAYETYTNIGTGLSRMMGFLG